MIVYIVCTIVFNIQAMVTISDLCGSDHFLICSSSGNNNTRQSFLLLSSNVNTSYGGGAQGRRPRLVVVIFNFLFREGAPHSGTRSVHKGRLVPWLSLIPIRSMGPFLLVLLIDYFLRDKPRK